MSPRTPSTPGLPEKLAPSSFSNTYEVPVRDAHSSNACWMIGRQFDSLP